MNWVEVIQKELPSPALALAMFIEECGYKLEPYQFRSAMAFLAYPQMADSWERQIGKTLTTALTSEFCSSIMGLRGCYLVPMQGQIEAPLEYWLSTPFVDKFSSDWLYINGKKRIHLSPITNNNVRSQHYDYLNFDENAACTRKQDILCDVAKYMVQNSRWGGIHYISTPVTGTGFEKKFLDLEKQGNAFHYNFHNIPLNSNWFGPAWTKIQEQWQDVLRGHYPLHLFKQEILAEFAAAGGTIFSDWEVGVPAFVPGRGDYCPEFIGVDCNPVFGHTAVVLERTSPFETYIKEELDLGADSYVAAARMKERMRSNSTLVIEGNGPGKELYKTFKKVFCPNGKVDFEGQLLCLDIDEDSRTTRVFKMLHDHFIINPKAEQTLAQHKGYGWDPNAKSKPLKTPNDHYIDAECLAFQVMANPQGKWKVGSNA